jgi:hypothetical protein
MEQRVPQVAQQHWSVLMRLQWERLVVSKDKLIHHQP